MKITIEKLGREVEAPDGWVVVEHGTVRADDLTWQEENGTGCWGTPALYGVGGSVAGYWCVLRRWVDGGAGI